MALRHWVVLAAVACGGSGIEVPIQGLAISECLDDGDTDVPTEELLVVGQERAIAVAHRSFEANCCHELELSATREEGGDTVVVSYTDTTDEPCDCLCRFDLGYTLSEVPAGTWIVQVPGHQAQVGVD